MISGCKDTTFPVSPKFSSAKIAVSPKFLLPQFRVSPKFSLLCPPSRKSFGTLVEQNGAKIVRQYTNVQAGRRWQHRIVSCERQAHCWIHNKRNENGCVLAYIFIYGGIINLTATRGCVKSNWHTLFVDYTVEHHSSTWSTTSPS